MNKENYLNPPEPDCVCCPMCDSECETVYSCGGDIVGCDICIDKIDAYEWDAVEQELARSAENDRKYQEWKDK